MMNSASDPNLLCSVNMSFMRRISPIPGMKMRIAVECRVRRSSSKQMHSSRRRIRSYGICRSSRRLIVVAVFSEYRFSNFTS